MLIGEGKIRDAKLLRNLDAIADYEDQANKILDMINLMGETSQIHSQQEREMFQGRIKGASAVVVDLTEKLERYLPEVIIDIAKHINCIHSSR